MNHHYSDIRSKIIEPPTWFDEQAVPRYCPFAPGESSDIYADEVALVEIACQSCDTRFMAAFSHGSTSWSRGELKAHGQWTPDDVRKFHYGDPPNVACCMSGPTMNSVPLRCVEFWRKGGEEFTEPMPDHPGLRRCLPGYFDWRRITENEITIDCEWAEVPRG